MAKKQVRSLYEIVVEVDESSTVNNVLDDADYILGGSSIRPFIVTPDDIVISSDEDLQQFLQLA